MGRWMWETFVNLLTIRAYSNESTPDISGAEKVRDDAKHGGDICTDDTCGTNIKYL